MKTAGIDVSGSPVFDLWKEAGRVIDVTGNRPIKRHFIRY